MTIRGYEPSDWDAVREIYDLAKPDEMRGSVDLHAILALENDPIQLALFNSSTIVLFEEDGRILGFGGYQGNYLSWLFVHPAHRRKGVARALVREMLGRLRGTVTLNVGRNNRAARALYETLGFVVDHEFAGKFNGHDVQVVKLKYDNVG